jgi:S-DNA-T family DNA segregation ATPase FtsK/SpoIIIE
MKLITPTQHKRLNEATGVVLLSAGIFLWLSLLSYESQDPSWNTATGASTHPLNLTGYFGSYLSDLMLQTFGLAAFAFPILSLLLAWKWLRSDDLEAPAAKLIGSAVFLLSFGAALSFAPDWRLFGGTIRLGGALGLLLADYLVDSLNMAGAILLVITALIVSVYLISTFTMEKFVSWFAPLVDRWNVWREQVEQRKTNPGRSPRPSRSPKKRRSLTRYRFARWKILRRGKRPRPRHPRRSPLCNIQHPTSNIRSFISRRRIC